MICFKVSGSPPHACYESCRPEGTLIAMVIGSFREGGSSGEGPRDP